ncbi:MAG: RnfABCDGE type electron transport complex subunit D [Clostridia bacterium]|nr:RnfABCDGE type electron transport complex subunit D [Clostridia bacterium]
MENKTRKLNTVKASQIFGDYTVMILAPCILSVLYYGSRALQVILVSIASAVISDLAASVILKKKFLLKDLSNIFIGAAIAVMLPAGVPLYVPAIASTTGVLVAKIPFGGSLRAPFVPAAAGFATVSVCFKDLVFAYTENVEDKLLGAQSLASLLSQGNSVHFNLGNAFDILVGNIAGPMGTGCGILMLVCGGYLFVRRRSALLATAGFIGACAVFAALFPRINATLLTRIILELSAGSLLFGAVFLITDHATLPKGNINKIIYGAVCGALCMMMRYNGTYEETVCFAVLLTNGFSPVIESSLKAVQALKSKSKGAAVK